jgi:hypothetical protein
MSSPIAFREFSEDDYLRPHPDKDRKPAFWCLKTGLFSGLTAVSGHLSGSPKNQDLTSLGFERGYAGELIPPSR